MRETYCLFLNAAESGLSDREKPCVIGGGNRPLVRFCCVGGKHIGLGENLRHSGKAGAGTRALIGNHPPMRHGSLAVSSRQTRAVITTIYSLFYPEFRLAQ